MLLINIIIEATTVNYTSVNVITGSTPTLSNIELNATFTGTEGEIVINRVVLHAKKITE